MDWLQQTQDQLTSLAANDLDPYDTPPEISSLLDLVSGVAGGIKEILDRAADSEARAKALAEDALEKLQLAEALIDSAKTARTLAEETVAKLSARLREETREVTQLRMATAQPPLANAKQHMSAYEMPAGNAGQIDEVRTLLARLYRNQTGRSLRAA
jgi:hypothetical protein